MNAIEFSFVATPQLGPKALRFLLKRRSRGTLPVVVVLLVVLIAYLAAEPSQRALAYIFAGASMMLFVIFLLAVAYRRRLRKRFFASTSDHTIRVSMDEAAVTVSTGMGSATLPWSRFVRVWEGEDVILLFYDGWQYLAFPWDAVPAEAMRLAESKIKGR